MRMTGRRPMGGAAAVGLLAAALATCHQVILTAPPESTITVHANPPFIPAHGGVSEITAVVIEPIGTPVPDGTVVQFFTTLGRIDEQGKTNDGVARVNLVSDSRSGEAQVRAISGPATSDEITVRIGSALPARVFVTAAPRRLTSSRSAQIFALVVDEFGNPVPNVPVLFEVSDVGVVVPSPGPSPAPSPTPPAAVATERMDSAGRPVFTDNSGRAEDVLRTSWPRDALQRIVEVTVTVVTGTGEITDSVGVVIN